jgi:hypothetical protein
MVTPRVDVRELADCRDAFWSPAEMPLRYGAAPLLIDNVGQSDIPGLAEQLDGVRRGSWTARFASAFRSRKAPLPGELGRAIVEAWDRIAHDPDARAPAYWHALPRRHFPVDADRESTYRRLRSAAIGEPISRRCR